MSGWMADMPIGAIRDVIVAVAVGAGLTVHQGLDFAWQMPLLLLAGISCLVSGGRILLAAPERAGSGAGDELEHSGLEPYADAPTRPSVSPQRHGMSLITAGIVCFLPLTLVAGRLPVLLLIASAAITVGVVRRFVPVAVRSQAEIIARLGLTAAVVGGVVLARGGSLTIDMAIAVFQLGSIAVVIGSVTNLRDLLQDRKTGRKTLVARFGVQAGRIEVTLLCLGSYAVSFFWLLFGARDAAVLPLLALPLAAWIVRDVNLLPPGPRMDSIRPRAAALQLALGSLLAVGLAL
jgi:1,4-dihydroxy-2-naphthoate octaprenyltransferase